MGVNLGSDTSFYNADEIAGVAPPGPEAQLLLDDTGAQLLDDLDDPLEDHQA